MKPSPPATPEELCSIGERALALWESLDLDSDVSDAQRERRFLLYRSAVEAVRLCAVVGHSTGTVSLLPIVARGLELLGVSSFYDEYRDFDVLSEALERLLAAGGRAADVEDLRWADDARVRRAVAAGLRPAGPEERALLASLAEDPDPEVRRPAQETLAELEEVPWWTGKFGDDPLADVPAEEAERYRQPLEAIAKLLDLPRPKLAEHDAELAALAGSLPDDAARDVAFATLRGPTAAATHLPALGAMMVSRPGGAETLVALLDQWVMLPGFFVKDAHARMIKEASPDRRIEACIALARRAVLPLTEEDELFGARPPWVAAELVGHAFPAEADPTPLVDIVLTVAPGEHSHVAWHLAKVVSASSAVPAQLMDRFVEAHLAGCPGAWCHLRDAVQAILANAPPELRQSVAERSALADDAGTASWGLCRLLLADHDPDRDPPPYEQAGRFFGDPRERGLLLPPHGDPNLAAPWLREALRRGELDFPNAVAAVRAVSALWGWTRAPKGSAEAKRHRDVRARYAALLGPRRLHGPVTRAELRELRRARSRWTAWTEAVYRETLFHGLPDGPLHDEDRAFLEQALRFTEEEDKDLAFLVSTVIDNKGTAADAPMYDRLLATVPDGEDGELLRRTANRFRERVGLPALPDDEEEEEPPAPQGGEWMDEPEDDDAS